MFAVQPNAQARSQLIKDGTGDAPGRWQSTAGSSNFQRGLEAGRRGAAGFHEAVQGGMDLGSPQLLKDATAGGQSQGFRSSGDPEKELISGNVSRIAPGGIPGAKQQMSIAGDMPSIFRTGFDPNAVTPWSDWNNTALLNPFRESYSYIPVVNARGFDARDLKRSDHYSLQKSDTPDILVKKIDHMIATTELATRQASDTAGFYPQNFIDIILDNASYAYKASDDIYSDIGAMFDGINQMYGALDNNYSMLGKYPEITPALAADFNGASNAMADHVADMRRSVENMRQWVEGQSRRFREFLANLNTIGEQGEDIVDNYNLSKKEMLAMKKEVRSAKGKLADGGFGYEKRGEDAQGYFEAIAGYFGDLADYSKKQLGNVREIVDYIQGILDYLDKIKDDLDQTEEDLEKTEDYFRGATIEPSESSQAQADICGGAEPKGMSTLRDCQVTCRSGCRFKKKVGDTNCYECPSGSPDTCWDVGAWPSDHPWCNPGGLCYEDPMLYCMPFSTITPNNFTVTCTNCKPRPDECATKGPGGMTITNCRQACKGVGKCEFLGQYKELDIAGDGTTTKDDVIHCFECVPPPPPPPPPTCEQLGWGYNTEPNCKANCPDPDICIERLNKVVDKDAQDDEDDDQDDDGDDDGGEDDGGDDGAGGGGPQEHDTPDDAGDDADSGTDDDGDDGDINEPDPGGGTPEQPDGGPSQIAGGEPRVGGQDMDRGETPRAPADRPQGTTPDQPDKSIQTTPPNVDPPPQPEDSVDQLIQEAEATAQSVIDEADEAAIEASGRYDTQNMRWLQSRLDTVDKQIEKYEAWQVDPEWQYEDTQRSLARYLEGYRSDRERILEQMEEEKERVREEIREEREEARRREESRQRSREHWQRLRQIDIDAQNKWKQKQIDEFEEINTHLQERAEYLQSAITNRRNRLEEMERRLTAMKNEIEYRKEEQLDNDDYDESHIEDVISKLEADMADLYGRYSQLKEGLEEFERAAKSEIDGLMSQYRTELFDIDEGARRRVESERIDEYMMWHEELRQVRAVRRESDRAFEAIVSGMESKINEATAAGDEDLAEQLQEELDNIKRGKAEWDAVYDSREASLENTLSNLGWRNYKEGAGPTNSSHLHSLVNSYGELYDEEIAKFEALERHLEEGLANGTYDDAITGTDGDLTKVRAHLNALRSAREGLTTNGEVLSQDFQLSQEHAESVINSATRVAEGSRNRGEDPTFAEHFAEALAEEYINNLNPVTMVKKSVAFGWGMVQGTASAVYGLGELAVGAVDLTMESYAQWLGFEDGGIFGTDASDALYGVLAGGYDYGSQGFDGVIQAAIDAGGLIDAKLTEIERSGDIDWATAEAGGKIAGEVVLGEYIIEAGLGRLGTAFRVTDEVADATRAVENLDDARIGTGQLDTDLGIPEARTPDIDSAVPTGPDATGAPTRTPDMDTQPIRGPDTERPTGPDGSRPDGSAPRQPDTAGPEARAPPSQVDEALKYDGPPRQANRIDDSGPLEQRGTATTQLDEDTLTTLEQDHGFKAEHAQRMQEFAEEQGVFLIVRDGNPDSVRYFGDADAVPKPMSSKAKTAKVGEDLGLVVNPRHPRQARFWEEELANARRVADETGDSSRLNWLEDQHERALEAWDKYGDKMLDTGNYQVDDLGRVRIKVENPDGTSSWKMLHGDYDLHGVYRPNADGTIDHVSFGSGQRFDAREMDLEGTSLRSQLNDKLGTGDKDFIQHGGQDDWIPDPHYVPTKYADPPAVAFAPDGSGPYYLENYDDMKRFYEDVMGVEFQYQPKPKSGGSTPRVDGPSDVGQPPDVPGDGGGPSGTSGSDGTGGVPPDVPPGGGTPPRGPPNDGPGSGAASSGAPDPSGRRVTTAIDENTDLHFTPEGSSEVTTLRTGQEINKGKTSSVYVDGNNPDRVIRITSEGGSRARTLDEVGREAVENIQGDGTGPLRVVERYDHYDVTPTEGSALNNQHIEVNERMHQGTAKQMIESQGGQMRTNQAIALDRATRQLNDNGYTWFDNHHKNYTFELIEGTEDQWRVVVLDPGGIVPMRGDTLAERAANARAAQQAINNPPDYVTETLNRTGDGEGKVVERFMGMHRQDILREHGKNINIEAMGLDGPNDVGFYPSGLHGYDEAQQLFRMSPEEARQFYGE